MIHPVLILMMIAITFSTSFNYGYQTGVINQPETFMEKLINDTFLKRYGPPTDEHTRLIFSFCVSTFLIGGTIGALIAGPMMLKLGRKLTILILSVPCMIGCILLMCSKVAVSFELIIFARLIIGISCGAFTVVAPIYLSETAPKSIRGAASTLNQLMIVISISISQVLGLRQIMGTDELWPYLLGLNLIVILIGVIILAFLPESPRFLYLIKNDPDAAAKALKKLRGQSADISEELDQLEYEKMNQSQGAKCSEICKAPDLRLALIVCLVAHIGQQLSGINGLIYYSNQLFRSSGLSEDDSLYATMGIGFVNLVITLISVFLIERFGRRPLLISGFAVALFSLLMFSILQGVNETANQQGLRYAGIFFIYLYIVGFGLGIGAIPWFMTSEMFPQENRDAASGVVSTVNWICNVAIGLGFPRLIDAIKIFAFVPSCVIILIVIIVLARFQPETKNRTIPEVRQDLKRRLCEKGSDYDDFDEELYSDVLANEKKVPYT